METDKAPFAEVIRQLQAYFDEELREFDLPLAPEERSSNWRVWNTLRTIPYGETISYAQLAQKIGDPRRCAQSGSPMVRIPFHHHSLPRVIGSNGSLTGFGGGLSNKKKLAGPRKQTAEFALNRDVEAEQSKRKKAGLRSATRPSCLRRRNSA